MTIPYRKIMVTLDGSELAAKALPEATRMAKLFGADVLLVRVVDNVYKRELQQAPETMVDQVSAYTQSHTNQQLQAVVAAQNTVASELTSQGLHATSLVEAGEPAQVILEIAGREAADLLVMSTHGRTGLSRLVYGSVAERVLQGAPCPVLLVRAGQT
jgi:nucleotide-binding universal stress UspA family protein